MCQTMGEGWAGLVVPAEFGVNVSRGSDTVMNRMVPYGGIDYNRSYAQAQVIYVCVTS